MSELKVAIIVLGIITLALIILLLGDLLGHKIGRRRLAEISGVVLLVSVVTFAIYAAIVLL
jgi:hypothetical protein